MVDEKPPKKLKKVVERGSWTFDPAVLYRDDIERIYGLFRQVSDGVTIRLAGYQLDSPADAALVERVAETRDVEITSANPYCSFGVVAHSFWFYVADRENLVLLGLRDAITQVVAKRRLWTLSLRQVMVPLWLFIIASWLTLLLPKNDPLYVAGSLVSFAGIAVFLGIGAIAYRNRFRRDGRVILRDSDSKLSFRQAHHEALLVLLGSVLGLVSTVVGGVLAFIILIALGLVAKP